MLDAVKSVFPGLHGKDECMPGVLQRLLASLHAPIVGAGRRAVEMPLAALHSSTPELDLLALAHPRGDARSFAT